MKEIIITIKSELENILNMRNMISSLIVTKNQTISFINEVKTLVSEGITNAIIHGYDDMYDKDITIRVKMDETGLYLEIEDYGKGIANISEAKEVLFTTKREDERSGLGFTILELFSSEFSVISEQNLGTKLIIFKAWE